MWAKQQLKKDGSKKLRAGREKNRNKETEIQANCGKWNLGAYNGDEKGGKRKEKLRQKEMNNI